MPFPREETTPPVMKMNFIIFAQDTLPFTSCQGTGKMRSPFSLKWNGPSTRRALRLYSCEAIPLDNGSYRLPLARGRIRVVFTLWVSAPDLPEPGALGSIPGWVLPTWSQTQSARELRLVNRRVESCPFYREPVKRPAPRRSGGWILPSPG